MLFAIGVARPPISSRAPMFRAAAVYRFRQRRRWAEAGQNFSVSAVLFDYVLTAPLCRLRRQYLAGSIKDNWSIFCTTR